MTATTDRISTLVEEISLGAIPRDRAGDPTGTLTEKGLSSLSYLQLIDAVETEFGVYVDLEGDTTFLQSVEGIAGYIAEQST